MHSFEISSDFFANNPRLITLEITFSVSLFTPNCFAPSSLFSFLSFYLPVLAAAPDTPISPLLLLLSTIFYLSNRYLIHNFTIPFFMMYSYYLQTTPIILLTCSYIQAITTSLSTQWSFLEVPNHFPLIFSVSISIIFSFRFLSSLQLQTWYFHCNTIQESLLTY